MTTSRDPEITISAWLDQMPDRVSDRVIDGVLQAVATTPQVRRPFAGRLWRPTIVNRFVLIAAAIALGVVVVGGAVYFMHNNSTAPIPPAASKGAPSAAPTRTPAAPTTPPATSTAGPTAAPSASAAGFGAPLPAELQARWMGSHRGFAVPGAGSSLLLGATNLQFGQTNVNQAPHVIATIGSPATGMLHIGDASYWTCGTGSTGDYEWSLSPSGRILTLSLVVDSCAGRSQDVPGTYWLDGCKDPGTDCLGNLDPGTYSSQYIRPLPVDPWVPLYGGITYTLPDGWANFSDWGGSFGLTTSGDFAATSVDNVYPAAAVEVFNDARPVAAQCTDNPADTQLSALDLFNNMGDVVFRSNPQVTTVGGYSGYTVDITPNKDITRQTSSPCATDTSYFYAGGDAQGIDPDVAQQLTLLDLPDGKVLAIRVTASPARLADFAAAAAPIIQSMTFH